MTFTFFGLTRSSAFRRWRCVYLGSCEPNTDLCNNDPVHGRRGGGAQPAGLVDSKGLVPALRYPHTLGWTTQRGPQRNVNRWDDRLGGYDCAFQPGWRRLGGTAQSNLAQLSSNEVCRRGMGQPVVKRGEDDERGGLKTCCVILRYVKKLGRRLVRWALGADLISRNFGRASWVPRAHHAPHLKSRNVLD